MSPQFSKVYQLLATSLLKLHRTEEAVQVLQQGYAVADERGDNIPRDEMAKMLTQLGNRSTGVEAEPRPARTAVSAASGRAARHGTCPPIPPNPPMSDELGRRIYETVCADCWNDWLRNYSIKVINELRLDLSTDRGQEEYDRYMREFLGLE